MRILFWITLIGAVILLALSSIQPAAVSFLLTFPFACATIPLLGVWGLLLFAFFLNDLVNQFDPELRRYRWGFWTVGVVVLTALLGWFHIPARIVFSFYQDEFQALAAAENLPPNRDRQQIDRAIGPYHVDEYAADPEGGVYFRTATGPDGIGPDQFSYGFAYQPNNHQTPFGRSRYQLDHLFGDWFVFEVSND
jgi:hypothetical protein